MSKSSLLLTAILLMIFLAGCTSGTTPTTEINILITVTPPPLPTKTVLTPTEIASLTPAPDVNYFSLSSEQKLELSKSLVEQASGFSGEVALPVELNGKTYYFYWDPTAVDKYETDAVGGWKTEQKNPNVDKTGESLPQMLIPAIENPDGSITVIDPVTGQETVYANPNIPALGGVISYRDLFNMSQAELSKLVTDAGTSFFSNNPDEIKKLNKLREQSVYLPVLLYGEQTATYASGADNGTGTMDIPEENFSAIQSPTNNALIPIYSPETGKLLYCINLMAANATRNMRITYSSDGTISGGYDTVGQDASFVHNQQDQFGIIVQSRHPQVAHNLGGYYVLIENSPAVGDVNVVEEVFAANSEAKIQDILNTYRLLVAYPSIIYRPER
jgi:hypothetical protein